MNFKILITTVLLIGFNLSSQAQIVISSGDELIKELEQKAEQQRAAEIADPTLSKSRSGRIATKEEKKAMQKTRRENHQKLVKALKTEKNKNGGKMKIASSKNKKIQPTKGIMKQPTRGTIKKQKIKE